ncbi:MAG: glycine cleavage system protein H, partial [Chloroflexota bacterium]|nr:glycine cleavage system protein H [Chloroflexota bacterium]
APISGKVEAINEQLTSAPETVNTDALGSGWFIKVRPTNPADVNKLLDAAAYQKKIEAGEIH